jgi:hypothetical protein
MKKIPIKLKIKNISTYATRLEELEKIRNIPIKFSLNEIHDLHMALRECVSLQYYDKEHKDKFGVKCPYCKNYKLLHNRIVKHCNCMDNPKWRKLYGKVD